MRPLTGDDQLLMTLEGLCQSIARLVEAARELAAIDPDAAANDDARLEGDEPMPADVLGTMEDSGSETRGNGRTNPMERST